MPRVSRQTNNYSLIIYQSKKRRKQVYLQLLYNGEEIDDPEYKMYGGFKKVAKVAFLLIHYARTQEKSFKAAWDADEVWD